MSDFHLLIRRIDDKELSDLVSSIRSDWPDDETRLSVELAPGITRDKTEGLDAPGSHNIINLNIFFDIIQE
ncbi:hypothetical protein LOC54_07440 [Acetobacter sp. AN02]|uniref:hypothetical protein n=1 Tax=Acetobacter sp. AN02 TaxID=2894186 RepID=UPI002434206D|nr:hypothetical protein [Acetobacter sp. AN02]MDG6094943.1 hypothetical protein [Acetobacter sp. AN02]